MDTLHEAYMRRCLQLAAMGAGRVAPNPMVGAMLVHEHRIIGEGYHQQYGQAHAEVNCIASVKEADKPLIAAATLYVSLEPCAHFGKTPPCADLVIANNIPRVVIGCKDLFAAVNGRGIEKLVNAGINVQTGVLEKECLAINKRFFTFHQRQRPYIILKWAQTSDGFMAPLNFREGEIPERLLISNEFTNRLVHRWRSEEAAILVGTNTVLLDDPALTNRLWSGPSPIRLVIDKKLHLPLSLQLFNDEAPTIVFNEKKEGNEGNVQYQQLHSNESFLPQLLQRLYEQKVQSMLVEGGQQLLQSFIDGGYWDEARVITNEKMLTGRGLEAPRLQHAEQFDITQIAGDRIDFLKKKND